ncbi:hypothetical protein L6452_37421 [Arctium lappa]|uniref:Uncharacterized protein n=1 Tax=Arctium lappa TaxID=4217 RepID=A0ACB8Y3F8_ARCLA|nr:hypothetical protein L6452_37421 [Arctium lappa]
MSNVFSPGELIGLLRAERMGRALEEAICYRAVLLGITRASMNTQSFISEARGYSSYLMTAATLGAMGYCYMWWKSTKRHLSKRLENLDWKLDEYKEMSKLIADDVNDVKSNLN